MTTKSTSLFVGTEGSSGGSAGRANRKSGSTRATFLVMSQYIDDGLERNNLLSNESREQILLTSRTQATIVDEGQLVIELIDKEGNSVGQVAGDTEDSFSLESFSMLLLQCAASVPPKRAILARVQTCDPKHPGVKNLVSLCYCIRFSLRFTFVLATLKRCLTTARSFP